MSSGGEEPQSPSNDKSLSNADDEITIEDHAEEKGNRKTKPTANSSKKTSDFPTLINRRSKIVNGNPRDRKQVRNKGIRDIEREREEMMREKDARNIDSGLGRVSAESAKSSTPEYSARRRVWEQESGDSEGGQRDGNRGGGPQAIGTAAKKEEMARLEKELEQELRYRATLEKLYVVWRYLTSKDQDTIQWSVDVLQQSVQQLQQQLDAMSSGQEEGGEYKLRYEAQLELNDKLEEQTVWYLEEVEKTRDKVKRGQEYTYDQDLDQYNEFELLRLMKNLERERNNLYSDFRNKSWLLDNQSKEYHHLKELIHAYTGDLTMVNRSLEHLWRQRSISNDSAFAGGSTPVTSPGGVKWRFVLDAVRERSGQAGIRPSHRILDPRKGPIRKTVGVRSLPRLDQEAIEFYEDRSIFRKGRSRSRGRTRVRAKSLDVKKDASAVDVVAPLSPMLPGKGDEAPSLRSSSGVFDESYEASNEASTTASVELSSDKI